jgi:hypothetical protein
MKWLVGGEDQAEQRFSDRVVSGHWRGSGRSAIFRSRSARSIRVVRRNETSYLERDSAALGEIANPHFCLILSILGRDAME